MVNFVVECSRSWGCFSASRSDRVLCRDRLQAHRQRDSAMRMGMEMGTGTGTGMGTVDCMQEMHNPITSVAVTATATATATLTRA